jgi:hypothetical protein
LHDAGAGRAHRVDISQVADAGLGPEVGERAQCLGASRHDAHGGPSTQQLSRDDSAEESGGASDENRSRDIT